VILKGGREENFVESLKKSINVLVECIYVLGSLCF